MAAAGPRRDRGGSTTTRSQRRRTVRLVLAALSFLSALAGVGLFLTHLHASPLHDLQSYYLAAQRLDEGRPLYPASMDPTMPDAYPYPPLLAIVLRPLVHWIDFRTFAALWTSATYVGMVAIVLRVGVRYETLVAAGFLGLPIGFALAVGQSHVLLTLLLTVGAPWAVALAANIKLFPILVAVYWLGRRDGLALRRLAVWLVGLAAFQVAMEPEASFQYLEVLRPSWVGTGLQNWSPYVVSPFLWAALLAGGIVAAWRLARTRWGWPAAVALATLAPPRLLLYMPLELLAAFRAPHRQVEAGPVAVVAEPPAPGEAPA